MLANTFKNETNLLVTMFLKHGKKHLQEGQCYFVENFMQIMVKAEGRIPGRWSIFFYLVFPLHHIVNIFPTLCELI